MVPLPPTPAPSSYDGPGARFVNIAGLEGANRLSVVSGCDDCSQQVILPFWFTWLERFETTSLLVSSNGRINVNNCGYNETCGVINVVGTDLDPRFSPSTGGIYTFDAYNEVPAWVESEGKQAPSLDAVMPWGSFIISWEDVPVCCFDDDTLVNGQVHLYPYGRIDICWGDGEDGTNFTASVLDLMGGNFYPAQGPFFDATGQNTGVYPRFSCVTFFGESDEWKDSIEEMHRLTRFCFQFERLWICPTADAIPWFVPKAFPKLELQP